MMGELLSCIELINVHGKNLSPKIVLGDACSCDLLLIDIDLNVQVWLDLCAKFGIKG